MEQADRTSAEGRKGWGDAFPWEALNHWGVAGESPEDIGQVLIFTMEEGAIPAYSFSPTGKKNQGKLACEPLVQGEDYALSYLDSQMEGPWPLSEVQREPCYCVKFVLENTSDQRRNYSLAVTAINGKPCTYIDCGTLVPGCSTVIYIEADYRSLGLSGKVVQNVTLELDWQDNFGEPIAWEEGTVYPDFQLPQ